MSAIGGKADAAILLAVDVRPHCLPNSKFKASDELLNSLRDEQNSKHKRDGARDGQGRIVCKKHGVRHSPASDVTSILTCHRAWVAAVRKPRQVENSGQLAWLTEGRILPNSQTRPCGLVSHRARAKNSAAFVRYSSLIVIAIPGMSLTHLLGRTQTAGDGSATRQKKKGCRGKAALAPRCYRHFGGWGRGRQHRTNIY
jgi:hypothetical protein